MIAYLQGEVSKILGKSLILIVNGVGYEVVTTNTVLTAATVGKELEIFIHTYVREDQLVLYGFNSLSEREFFRQLIAVSGIGPKTALEMLGQPMDLLKQAIVNKDAAMIAQTPGIGKKTAERVIVELKSKIDLMPILDEGKTIVEYSVKEEVVVALEGLGYRRQQVVRFLSQVPDELETAEEIVTHFLKSV